MSTSTYSSRSKNSESERQLVSDLDVEVVGAIDS